MLVPAWRQKGQEIGIRSRSRQGRPTARLPEATVSSAEASWARSVSEERNATLPGPEELSSWSLWSLVWLGMVARSSLARSRKLRRGTSLLLAPSGGQRAWRSDKGCRRLKREGTS